MEVNVSLVLPIVVSVVIAFFKKELGNLLLVYSIYRIMKKKDRTPNEADKCQILSGATGDWLTVTVMDYVFSISKAKRGVFVQHSVGENKTSTEVFTFANWNTMRKRSIPS